MKTLVFASRNAGKVVEVRRLLEPLGFSVQTMAEVGIGVDLPEEEDSFEGNALSKARGLRGLLASPSSWTLADDSGLAVDALRGRPGVHSARYAGLGGADGATRDRANNEKLLRELDGLPREKRGARFVCSMVLLGPELELQVRGECPGRILEKPRGQGGFGYDPLFMPEGFERSMAELSLDEKNRISHRGRALKALVARLRALDS